MKCCLTITNRDVWGGEPDLNLKKMLRGGFHSSRFLSITHEKKKKEEKTLALENPSLGRYLFPGVDFVLTAVLVDGVVWKGCS